MFQDIDYNLGVKSNLYDVTINHLYVFAVTKPPGCMYPLFHEMIQQNLKFFQREKKTQCLNDTLLKVEKLFTLKGKKFTHRHCSEQVTELSVFASLPISW